MAGETFLHERGYPPHSRETATGYTRKTLYGTRIYSTYSDRRPALRHPVGLQALNIRNLSINREILTSQYDTDNF